MLNKMVVNTACLIFLTLTTTVQAGDIKPLHHAIYAGNAINWPKPTGASSPTGTGTSLNVAHGGSGSLAAGATKDQLRSTCPVGTQSFAVNEREKTPNTTTNVRAVHLPGLTPTIADNTGGNFVWGEVALKNTGVWGSNKLGCTSCQKWRDGSPSI